jgi:HrpA-like RNA helicase
MEIPKDIANIDAYKKPNAEGLSIELYRNLGYQTQEFVRKPEEKGILFTTTGILLQFLKTMTDEQFIKKFKFIIIDEAHDRSLDVDLILLLMKRLISRNLSKDPPFLILMSATLNVKEYSEYYNTKTIFEVNGQSKPIKVIYPSVDVNDIFSKSCEIVKSLEQYEEGGKQEDVKKGIRDVIIFMAATSPIKRMVSSLMNLNKELKNKILPLSITSMDINTGSENYRLLMAPYDKITVMIDGKEEPAYRRIIVSTNVAETGLTLESLRYCIDTALVFSSEINPRYGVNLLMTKPTTSSMSLQRKGRVGRKAAGIFFPLFTEETFNNMIVDNTPSIMIEDMTPHLLTLLVNEPINDVKKLPVYKMLTPPSDDSISYSLEKLFILGAIDKHAKATQVGKLLNLFRKMDMEPRKMILAGLAYNVSLKELITLASLVMIKKSDIVLDKRVSKTTPYDAGKLFDDMYQGDQKCDYTNFNKLKAKLVIGCEFIEMLLIYQRFCSRANLTIIKHREWCFEKGLNYRTLLKVTESIDEIYWQVLEQMKINPVKDQNQYSEIYQTLKRFNGTNRDLIDHVIAFKNCIYEGFKNNILIWNEQDKMYSTRHGLKVHVPSKLVSPLSYQKVGASFEQDIPKILIYKDLLLRANMQGRYEYEASTVSIMDGFVDVDLELANS